MQNGLRGTKKEVNYAEKGMNYHFALQNYELLCAMQ